MALDLDTLKDYSRVTSDDDNETLQRLLDAATKHVESDLGYALDDTDELPDGAPEDLEQAVLMTAAHWYDNRETVVVDGSAGVVPVGAADIIANHRKYSFG